MFGPAAKHRKVTSESQVFKDIWTELYCLVQHNNKPVCLICQETIAVFKDYNLKRHYDTKHKKYSELTGQL